MARTSNVLWNGHTRGSKIVYGGIHCYLPCHHPYQCNTKFNGEVEHYEKPKIMSEEDVIYYTAW